jgi:hypothetical protein
MTEKIDAAKYDSYFANNKMVQESVTREIIIPKGKLACILNKEPVDIVAEFKVEIQQGKAHLTMTSHRSYLKSKDFICNFDRLKSFYDWFFELGPKIIERKLDDQSNIDGYGLIFSDTYDVHVIDGMIF